MHARKPRATPQQPKSADPGQPGGGKGRKDVTGTMPDNIRVDPDLTEGHAGYDESGHSEIGPTKPAKENQR